MLIGVDASRAITIEQTGTEAYSLHLIQSLLSLAGQKSHRIRLYFNTPPSESLFKNSEHLERVIISSPRLWTHVRLANELRRRPPDVFFTPAHVIPLTYFGPSVATIHDLGYLYFPKSHPFRQKAYLRWSTKHNGKRAKRVIVDSKITKKDLINFYRIDSKKIDVIYPGVDPTFSAEFPTQTSENEDDISTTLKNYGIEPPYLFYIGTLHPRKNLTRLIDAYVASAVEHQLVLAGKIGWKADPILNKLSELEPNIRRRICLCGYVDHKDKRTLISAADALLFPSLYEGFGFPVLEGNACGTPVLTSNSSSLPEIAGDAALLVDPTDVDGISAGIQRILIDNPLRAQLVRAGLDNFRRFNWSITAKKVLQTLEAAVEQSQ